MNIKVGRFVVGGLIADVVRLVLGGLAQTLILAPLSEAEIRRNHPLLIDAMGTPPKMIQMVVINRLMGFTMVYLYAAMRPAFATRRSTVISAALLSCLIASLNWGVTAVMDLFSWRHVAVQTLTSLVAVLVATYVGSLIYSRGDSTHLKNAPLSVPTASA